MNIQYIDSGSRMSQAAVHNQTIYLAGQVGAPEKDVAGQTEDALAAVEKLLAATGSDKHHILSATIWLADMADFAAMNAVWDEWVSDTTPPPRACGESRLATPDYKVEILIIAAVK